jgi:hypothetical protein
MTFFHLAGGEHGRTRDLWLAGGVCRWCAGPGRRSAGVAGSEDRRTLRATDIDANEGVWRLVGKGGVSARLAPPGPVPRRLSLPVVHTSSFFLLGRIMVPMAPCHLVACLSYFGCRTLTSSSYGLVINF